MEILSLLGQVYQIQAFSRISHNNLRSANIDISPRQIHIHVSSLHFRILEVERQANLEKTQYQQHGYWGDNVCETFRHNFKHLYLPLSRLLVKGVTWWRHRMERFSALLAICAGNSPVPGEFHTQRPVTRSFDVFFALHLNKRLSKQ